MFKVVGERVPDDGSPVEKAASETSGRPVQDENSRKIKRKTDTTHVQQNEAEKQKVCELMASWLVKYLC
jgi:hypothetical protein